MTQAVLPFLSVKTSVRRVESRELFAHCPSCQKKSWFKYRGLQRWSESVAMACGLPTTMPLWTCETCHTTVSESSLRI